MTGPVRVGVIGCGYWGPNLVRNFARHPESRVLLGLRKCAADGEEILIVAVVR